MLKYGMISAIMLMIAGLTDYVNHLISTLTTEQWTIFWNDVLTKCLVAAIAATLIGMSTIPYATLFGQLELAKKMTACWAIVFCLSMSAAGMSLMMYIIGLNAA